MHLEHLLEMDLKVLEGGAARGAEQTIMLPAARFVLWTERARLRILVLSESLDSPQGADASSVLGVNG